MKIDEYIIMLNRVNFPNAGIRYPSRKIIIEVDPLICPRCGGDMRVIAFIEDYRIVKKILDYYDF